MNSFQSLNLIYFDFHCVFVMLLLFSIVQKRLLFNNILIMIKSYNKNKLIINLRS